MYGTIANLRRNDHPDKLTGLNSTALIREDARGNSEGAAEIFSSLWKNGKNETIVEGDL